MKEDTLLDHLMNWANTHIGVRALFKPKKKKKKLMKFQDNWSNSRFGITTTEA